VKLATTFFGIQVNAFFLMSLLCSKNVYINIILCLQKLKSSIGEFCEKCSPTHKKAVDYEGLFLEWSLDISLVTTICVIFSHCGKDFLK